MIVPNANTCSQLRYNSDQAKIVSHKYRFAFVLRRFSLKLLFPSKVADNYFTKIPAYQMLFSNSFITQTFNSVEMSL